jgi:glycolate oxidase iron-sulfur subunit
MTCVHCGFCLQACPTYRALGDENDSPRGRILLMRAVATGELELNDLAVETHIDRCLGCRACETACPSGVPYGELLEATRETMKLEGRRRPLIERMILGIFARPALLKPVLAAARLLRLTRISAILARIPGRLGFAMAMLESSRPIFKTVPYPAAPAQSRGRVSLLLGCVMDGLFASVHRASERTLGANGFTMVSAPGQRCCGALHLHSGDAETARSLARHNIAAFEKSGAEWIAVNSAGCGAMLEQYGALLANDPEWSERAAALAARVLDISELLARAGPAPGGTVAVRATYDAPCHLLHAQRVAEPPLAVLAAIPGLEIVPLTDADQCCGAAGIYNVVEPSTAAAVLSPKIDNIIQTGASLVVTGNPGCHMQIGAGLRQSGSAVRVVHLVELLDASYGARPRT